MKHYLSVDLGATSGRTALSTWDGNSLEMQEWTRFRNPQLPISGHIFWDLPQLYDENSKMQMQNCKTAKKLRATILTTAARAA